SPNGRTRVSSLCDSTSGKMKLFHALRPTKIITVTTPGRDIGRTRCQNTCRLEAPSRDMASYKELGTSRKELVRTTIEIGRVNAAVGRMIAMSVSYRCIRVMTR